MKEVGGLGRQVVAVQEAGHVTEGEPDCTERCALLKGVCGPKVNRT